ncbi:hypothetical protein U9M48_019111 [Paspalum notatum var. saurae]|uniref:Uncharacterized protein n=1 Tax=Paspalum notatum var. saurae TaxID=547442 RepID=A0AAQ3TBY6_PASNO
MTGSVQWSDSLTLHSAMIKRGSYMQQDSFEVLLYTGGSRTDRRTENASLGLSSESPCACGHNEDEEEEGVPLSEIGKHLARYTPTEVAEDGDKQEHFLEGLYDNL